MSKTAETFWDDRRTFRCETCMWYLKKKGQDLGRCRRHAPAMDGWPVVSPDDWCGDHKVELPRQKNG